MLVSTQDDRMAIAKQCKICLAIMIALKVSECGEGGVAWMGCGLVQGVG